MQRSLQILWVSLIVSACGSGSGDTGSAVSRETLADGTILVRYSALPELNSEPIDADLRIGVADGDEHSMFGDIRGIDAGSDGSIYVLDYQAAEIRAFDDQGRFLRTVATRGAGPGELNQANGMILVGDSALWIQDHGKMRMVALDLEGVELASIPMPVMSYGYIWNGTVDHQGLVWKPLSKLKPGEQYSNDDGLHASTSLSFLVHVHPKSGVRDTVYVGTLDSRSYVASYQSGRSVWGIPNDPTVITRVDPAGGFWRADDHAYRIARLDAAGDTVLVIEIPIEPAPVTDLDRHQFVERVAEQSPDRMPIAEAIAGLMPDTKAVIADLVIDDASRLWVRRAANEGAPTRFDVFDRDGDHLGGVRLAFSPSPYLSIRVRNDRIYALSPDSLTTPIVRRTPPIRLAGG